MLKDYVSSNDLKHYVNVQILNGVYNKIFNGSVLHVAYHKVTKSSFFIPSETFTRWWAHLFYLLTYRKVTSLQVVINNHSNEKEGFQYIDFLNEASGRQNTFTVHIM